MPRRYLMSGAAAALLVFASWLLWPPRTIPSFLLVTLDTTRADRLGCYGYPAGETPALDALADAGVLCERAFTVAPITLPSHATMFTGLFPAENGVVTNGRGRLDESIPTLAEVLKRNGYDTGAFVASFVLNRKFGLDLGFDTYDDEFATGEAASDVTHRQRSGAAVVDAALQWLATKREKPFFCWIHLYDPHSPYLPHTDLFGDTYVDRPYDAEIAYVDRQVQRLVDFLKVEGRDSQTLVVVVGDHGEGLADHVEQEHGMTLYDEALHVPLIFRHVGRLPARRRVVGNISLVDFSPTVLDLLGLHDSRRITGKSLQPAIMRNETPTGLVYSATDAPFLVDGWSPLRSLTDGTWKYIKTTKPELYDLAADPHERHNLVETVPDTARQMASRLADFESRLIPRDAIAVQLSAGERRALEALGYLGGSKRPATAKSDLPDVKDMLPFNARVEGAMKLAQAGSLKEAIELLREVIREAPLYPEAYCHLADVLRESSQLGDAEKVLRDLLAVRPDAPEGYAGLGMVLMQQGQAAGAIDQFRKAIEIDPEQAEAHYLVATLLLSSGQTANALAEFNAALSVDPQHVGGYEGRAKLLAQIGSPVEAIADYRMALKYAPDTAETHLNLGVLLANAGNIAEGERHLKRAVELNPQNPEIRYIFALYLIQQQRIEEAIGQLTRAVELKPGFAEAVRRLDEAKKSMATTPAVSSP
jgi:arylsulfatase A-like enzyme/tetratricopeptide (TPR) repeat protein